MCGIALIVDGIPIDVSSLFTSYTPAYPSPESEQPLFSVDDIKAALRRRGPDSLGTKKIFLHSHISDPVEEEGNLYISEEENLARRNLQGGKEGSSRDICRDETKYIGEFYFIGATLQLRGVNPIVQPLVDTSGNILAYNGEIFGGIHVSSDENDAEVLMESLGQCCPCTCLEDESSCCGSRNERNSIPVLLSTIRGPWALVYWQASSKTIWFGRDALGRRSLLVHWPTSKDPRLLLSSVSPPPSVNERPGFEEECRVDEHFWEELPCAVYSLRMSTSKLDSNVIGEVIRHDWTDSAINELISWDREYIHPDPQDLIVSQTTLTALQDDGLHSVHAAAEVPYETGFIHAPILLPSETVLISLKEAVMRRTATNAIFKVDKYDNIREGHAPIAVLFSGGLDSMILAALLDQCIDEKYEIDLLNVSFDNESAPDRISARAGLKELRRISPLRRWKLVEIDAELSTLISETKHVMSLINPAKTFMDINIGLALWLAAGGDGWVYEDGTHDADNYNNERRRTKYKSEAKILLVGSGADEQCAGYGRHKTKFKNGSWLGLNNEMKLDMQRIWKRNLGRDDRCIADNGKEARFPFLDEDVIKTLLSFPLWEIADLDQPSGKGDKKILREVAKMLGLNDAATLPKRAIQFGTRIARESNRKNFGSNRAANQASAGSVEIFNSGN